MLLLVSNALVGQILRVNKSHLRSDSSDYLTGAADLKFSINNLSSTPERENTFIGLESNLDLVYLLKRSALVTINQFRYFRPSDASPINNGSTHLRLITNRKRNISQEVYTQLQYDQSRQMTSRFLIGAGARFNLLRGDKEVYAGLGLFHENETWEENDRQIDVDFFKLNSYIGGEIDLTPSLSLNGIFYYQTGYDDSIGTLRNRFSSALEIKNNISQHFIFKTVASATYDQRPIIDIVKLFYTVEFGIEFKINN